MSNKSVINNEPPITIIIPTYNNREYLYPCLLSMVQRISTEGLFRVIVVNNGHKDSCEWIGSDIVTVVNTGKNLGWEGGLMEGLKHTKSPFVVFANDDIFIPPSSKDWLHKMVEHFRDPKVGAVGPASNTVMGNQQIWADLPYDLFVAKFLIGFCVMVRRSALDKIGGIDTKLPGGDDLDMSIRLRDAGYQLIVDRSIFVYHHGFKTGTRVNGDHLKAGGWNSWEMLHKTNTYLIQKHGFKKWFDTVVRGGEVQSLHTWADGTQDAEGEFIRSQIAEGSKVVDLGCGHNKTVDYAVGVDAIPKGEKINSLHDAISQADVVANVAGEMPFKDGEFDVVIARHIMEHCINPIQTLREWMRIVRTGGKLYIAVPNQELHNTIPMNMEHVTAFTPDRMRDLLEVLGLQVDEIHDPKNGVSFVAVATK